MLPRRRKQLGADSGSVRDDHADYGYSSESTFAFHTEDPSRFGPPVTTSQSLFNSEMNSRDRTNEFLTTVTSLRGQQPNGMKPPRTKRQVVHLEQFLEFMNIARLIGGDITKTYAKLEKLTLLAKRRSIFDDRSVEIQELTYIIKKDITSLNSQIARLQSLVKAKQSLKGRHMQTHSNTVVVGLQSKLASMSNQFQEVLEIRTENLKQEQARRDEYGNAPVATSMPMSAVKGFPSGSVLAKDAPDLDMLHGNGSVTIDMGGVQPSPNQLQQQAMLAVEQDSYVQERAETMQGIESTIVELGSIFQQLAHMVKEQEESIRRIDNNVEDAQLNIEEAHTEILKYFRSVTSNRWLMMKIFGILIVFFIIFVVLMA
ncbi:unnamed protein product [Notodromas monacha]|uniref:t-SNARE coiled-coil homology domain-containing protein n=1 Tax=Notodromas monacha TaxID=399045 RepID=A0A7R9BMA8_9CRUS|nr:unnamed protein product [Notodromas monacha]CAG0918135.1 unnamed protein product [Notodromas monacha]